MNEENENKTPDINDIIAGLTGGERRVPMASDAARWGLAMGGAMSAALLIRGLFITNATVNILLNIVSIVAVIMVLQLAVRARVVKRGKIMLDFGEAWGYTVLISLFAGMITGVAYYVNFRFIAHEYFSEAYRTLTLTVTKSPDVTDTLRLMDKVWNSPFVWFVSGIANTVFSGGFIGLIVAATGRRNPLIKS
ncbi:MAG: DUF4199 domain-containing protein [Rikenellaceae bacterium]|nr:DUF4199 domain-containing protein [Rikenellaceae bacterium]